MENFLVQAEYSFKGTNNDELCFKKGDIITVTQKEEGGWWEGTLDDKTGWFPSNYVKEYKTPVPINETIRAPEEIQAFRSVVLNDLLESERAHCAELRGLLENFLEPLETSEILTQDEYYQLMGNFVEVVDVHEELLKNVEESNDRVGKVFLSKAPIMKKIHHGYCSLHPRAVVIVDKFKESLNAFMEEQGAAKPGILVLTTGLSKPFRRLDKYSAILQELERHMESGHADRGDTQRSIAVYKELATSCSAIRRQKELELQILTGPIRNWQGKEINTMGDIIHMGSVAVGPDHRDRYFVLFPQNLLILSVSQRMSAFKYEGNIPIAGIIARRLEDTDSIKNAFEITGQLIEPILAVCQSSSDASKWVELLGKNNPAGIDIRQDLKRNTAFSSALNIPHQSSMSPPALGMSHPTRSTSQQISQHKRSLSFNHHLSYNQHQQLQQQQQLHHQTLKQIQMHHPVLPQRKEMSPLLAQNTKIAQTKNNWSITNLRHAYPLRPCFLTGGNSLTYALGSKKVQPTFEEDALVLRVIESYCAAFQNTSRHTMHSALQPFTPCLPIRGGKLKSSKHFSSSNPQLPFLCSSISSYLTHNQNNSTNSINNSEIWRVASPNNFNLYSSSIPSLNTTPIKSRYSANCKNDIRAASEERPPTYRPQQLQTPNNLKKISSNYDNVYNSNPNSPLLLRKNAQQKFWSKSPSNSPPPPHPMSMAQRTYKQYNTIANKPKETPNIIYDRRLNKSFETANGLMCENHNPSNKNNLKALFRRSSTPQLNSTDLVVEDNPRNSVNSTWCCGNFLKQWKKMNQY